MGQDTLLRIIAGLAAIVAALVGALIAFYGQIKVKDYELKVQRRKDKEAYVRKYYIPLLRFSYDLDRRIGHILVKLDTDWLSASHLARIARNDGFATNPNEKGYFIISSIYMFACFFGWIEAIKRGVDTTKQVKGKRKILIWFKKVKEIIGSWFLIPKKVNVFIFDPEISKVSKVFQYEEFFLDYMAVKKLSNPKDAAKLHKQFQYSIGELMLENDSPENLRCKSFREFFDAYINDEKFRYWFALLENLFTDLCDFEKNKAIEIQVEMKNDIRPLRLLAIRYWLRVLMKNISTELGIETLPPDEVLEPVSEGLRKTIKSLELGNLESYLLGVKIYN